MSSVALTGRVGSKITDVFSGVPVAFTVLVATVVFLWNTVGLSVASVAFSVADMAPSVCLVDFAETCVIFSLSDVVWCSTGSTGACEVLSLAGPVFPSCSVDVDWDLVVFSLADVASLMCSIVIWTDLSEANRVV